MEFVRYAFAAAGVGAIAYSLVFLLRYLRPEEGAEPAERIRDLIRFSGIAAAGLVAILVGVSVEF